MEQLIDLNSSDPDEAAIIEEERQQSAIEMPRPFDEALASLWSS
jgi:hypothetical protein